MKPCSINPLSRQHDLKVAIIGAGKIVEDAHLPVLKTMPGIRIAWITDQQPERRSLIEKMYSVRTLEPTAALTALADVDACLIAVPLGARKPYLENCAKFNVAAYIEKPFARSSTEHQREMDAFPSHAIAVGFQRRAYQTVQTLRQIIQSGMFGPLRAINLTEATFSLSSGGATSFRSSSASAGGGVAIESAIHSLDQILYVTSAQDIQTTEINGIVRDGIDYQVSLTSQLTMPHQSKVDVRVFLSRLQNRTDCFQFTFEHATVMLPGKPDQPLVISSQDTSIAPLTIATFSDRLFDPARTVNQAFIVFWDRFVAGLHDRNVNLTSAATSVLTTHWIEQIYDHLDSCGG